MLKAYKYRIYPNKTQEELLAKTFGCCRFVYNRTLAYRKEKYEKEKKSMSRTDCNNYCNRELKAEYEWLREVDKFALTNKCYIQHGFRLSEVFQRTCRVSQIQKQT